jgi:hypothetical protein
MLHADLEKLLVTLAADGRSPRTRETYLLMRRLFSRDQSQTGKAVDTAGARPWLPASVTS